MTDVRCMVKDFAEDEVIQRLCDGDRFDPNERCQFTIRHVEERMAWLESHGESR